MLYLFISVISLDGKCTHDYVGMYHNDISIFMPIGINIRSTFQ